MPPRVMEVRRGASTSPYAPQDKQQRQEEEHPRQEEEHRRREEVHQRQEEVQRQEEEHRRQEEERQGREEEQRQEEERQREEREWQQRWKEEWQRREEEQQRQEEERQRQEEGQQRQEEVQQRLEGEQQRREEEQRREDETKRQEDERQRQEEVQRREEGHQRQEDERQRQDEEQRREEEDEWQQRQEDERQRQEEKRQQKREEVQKWASRVHARVAEVPQRVAELLERVTKEKEMEVHSSAVPSKASNPLKPVCLGKCQLLGLKEAAAASSAVATSVQQVLGTHARDARARLIKEEGPKIKIIETESFSDLEVKKSPENKVQGKLRASKGDPMKLMAVEVKVKNILAEQLKHREACAGDRDLETLGIFLEDNGRQSKVARVQVCPEEEVRMEDREVGERVARRRSAMGKAEAQMYVRTPGLRREGARKV